MAKEDTTIGIHPIIKRKATVRIIGDTPLIVHAWDEKAKLMMLGKQTKQTKASAREAKNPVGDFVNSLYWMTPKPQTAYADIDEGTFENAVNAGARFGFPATGFKQAAISAAYRAGWVKDKMGLRSAFFVNPVTNGLVEIHGTPTMREDMVRIGMGTADIRYRGEFKSWSAELEIEYSEGGIFTLEQIVNVMNAGGFYCGVGEWRPEKDGDYGRFHVAVDGE